MTQLLHISASPRSDASETITLAQAFLDGYAAKHPDVEVKNRDLFDGSLPSFGALAAGAKMAVFAGGKPSPEQAGEWAAARAVFDEFAQADTYLFSIPMWNAGIPYVLKQWIDLVTQPGWVFGFTPESGYEGLIKGKRAAAIYCSGVYSQGVSIEFGTDFHSTFFNDWLRFAGFARDDVVEIRFQPTVLTASLDEDRATAVGAARSAGESF